MIIVIPVRALGNTETAKRGDRVLKLVAPVWQATYVVVHLWWVIGGAPDFLHGRESYFPGGWVPVAFGVLATVGCLAAAVTARRAIDTGRRHVLAGITAVAGVALCVYSFLFPVILVTLLFEGPRPGIVASLLATGGGAVGGVLCLRVAVGERRLAVRPCGSCGRVHGRSPESRAERAPGWAFAGAYLAVAGFVARMSVWLADTIAGRWPSEATLDGGVSWTAMVTFIVLMSLAGTLLPLALAHRWAGSGRPGWCRCAGGRCRDGWCSAPGCSSGRA